MIRKKLLAILIAVTMLISAIPASVHAEDDELTFIQLMYNVGEYSKEYFVSLGVGKIGGSLADAVARQPEAADTIDYASKTLLAYVDRLESKLAFVTLGKVGGSLMDAIARQPEASKTIIDTAVEIMDIVEEQGVKGDTEATVFTLGKLGGSAMDAIARQPEASEKIIQGIRMVAQESIGQPLEYSLALGKIGGSMMDAIARQPEATQKILDSCMEDITSLKKELHITSKNGTVNVESKNLVLLNENSSGSVSAWMDLELVKNAITTAYQGAANTIKIDATTPDDEYCDEIEFFIPNIYVEELLNIDALDKIVLKNSVADITLDKSALAEIAAKSNDDSIVTIKINKNNIDSSIKSEYVCNITTTNMDESASISKFAYGKITLSFDAPRGLAGVKAGCIMNTPSGERSLLNCYLNSNGKLSFDTQKLATFTVVSSSTAEKTIVNNTSMKLRSAKAAKKGSISLTFDRKKLAYPGTKYVSKYQIYRSTSKKFNKNLKKYTVYKYSKDTVSFKNSKSLKKNKRYYYKVRGIVELSNGNKAYTKWSNICSAKCKRSR